MGQNRIDAGIDFRIERDELGLSVLLRHRVIGVHLHRTQRLFPGHQVVRAIKSSHRKHENEQSALDESHSGFDILTK